MAVCGRAAGDCWDFRKAKLLLSMGAREELQAFPLAVHKTPSFIEDDLRRTSPRCMIGLLAMITPLRRKASSCDKASRSDGYFLLGLWGVPFSTIFTYFYGNLRGVLSQGVSEPCFTPSTDLLTCDPSGRSMVSKDDS